MKPIPLTKGHLAWVDDCDYDAITALGPWKYLAGYAVSYYVNPLGQKKRRWMHREVFMRMLGGPIPAGYQIDHVNAVEKGKTARALNYRSNLRLASRSQNQAAKRSQVNSSSGQKGVTFRQGKFDVRLRFYHRRIFLGRYTDFTLAVAVYQYAHRQLWQAFTSEGQGELCLPPELQATIDHQLDCFLSAGE